jgi:hypothetical protein
LLFQRGKPLRARPGRRPVVPQKGNRVWPTEVAVFSNRVVRYTPRLFGHFEETIGIEQVASVSVDAGVLFGDVIIETTGGSQPKR